MNSLVQQLRGTLPHVSFPEIAARVRQRLGQLRTRVSKHRRAIAVAGSVLLHIAFILALLPRTSEGLSAGGSGGDASGSGTGETFASVDLYAVAPAPAAMTKVKEPTDKEADALDTPTLASKLPADVLQTAPADAPQLTTLDTLLPSQTNDAAAPAQPASAAGGAGQAGTTNGAGDDLWNAIAPCWKQIAGADTLAVSLKVTLGPNGNLSKPPVIVRADAAAITPESLRSESLALSALAQCGAYPMAAGKQDITVNFPKPN